MIRKVKVSQAVLDTCDPAPLQEIFHEHEKEPQLTRMLQGTIGIEFPRAKELGPLVAFDPSVRAWGRKVFESIPHLLYYLAPGSGASLGLLATAFLDVDRYLEAPAEADDREVEDLLPLYTKYLVAAAIFAESVADDWRPIVERYAERMGERLRQGVPNAVEATLALEQR